MKNYSSREIVAVLNNIGYTMLLIAAIVVVCNIKVTRPSDGQNPKIEKSVTK